MGFLFNIRFFKEEKLGQEGVARTQEPIAEGQRGCSADALDLPEAVFSGICPQLLEGLGEP